MTAVFEADVHAGPSFSITSSRMVDYAVSKGRAALFGGLRPWQDGPVPTWAQNVVDHTNRPVLVAAPLAVAAQIVREAAKFDIEASRSSDGSCGIQESSSTNYELVWLHSTGRFRRRPSVTKAQSSNPSIGARKAEITEFMRKVPYRLLATAYAAPNDTSSLARHPRPRLSRLLGQCSTGSSG